ncbi:MAG: ABC transporter substrate-binding protein [Deltaproteobacteria bacterium]|nr:ABC transporter substrate-binding protein [Deltaproteobacteria bacterium]
MRRLALAAGTLLLAGAALAAEPIKIGAFFDLTGTNANIGTPTKLVAEMAVAEINKAGGINGRMIELVTADTQSDPTKGATVAKKFIYQDKVDAIIGPTRTDVGMNAKAVIEEAGIPTVMTVGSDPVITGGKFGPYAYIFKAPQRATTAVRTILAYLKEKKLTKVALLTGSDAFGKDGLGSLEQIAPEYGITFVGKESFGPKDTDMTAQLTNLKNASPDAIVCWTVGPAASIVSKNRTQLGLKIPLFQSHGLPDPKYIELAGKASEGDRMPATKLMAVDQLSDKDPQKKVIKEFVRLYRDVYKHEKDFPINTHSGYAWDALMLLTNAMKKAGTEPKALRAAIEATKGYVGVSGTYNMTPEDHNGLGLDSMVMVEVKNGKFVLAP